jgi:phage-related tail protein
METVDHRFKKWRAVAERCALICVLFIAGGWMGYMVGIQSLDDYTKEFDKRLVQERTDRIEEIKRLQETHAVALGAVSRIVERTARTAERAADKADTAAVKADTAADTAVSAATTAKGVATRARASTAPAGVPAATVNKSVREANRQLGSGK